MKTKKTKTRYLRCTASKSKTSENLKEKKKTYYSQENNNMNDNRLWLLEKLKHICVVSRQQRLNTWQVS